MYYYQSANWLHSERWRHVHRPPTRAEQTRRSPTEEPVFQSLDKSCLGWAGRPLILDGGLRLHSTQQLFGRDVAVVRIVSSSFFRLADELLLRVGRNEARHRHTLAVVREVGKLAMHWSSPSVATFSSWWHSA